MFKKGDKVKISSDCTWTGHNDSCLPDSIGTVDAYGTVFAYLTIKCVDGKYRSILKKELSLYKEEKICEHKWIATLGFNKTYYDCSICGAKKEDII